MSAEPKKRPGIVELDDKLQERIGFKTEEVETITLGETGFRVSFKDKDRPDRWYYYFTLFNQEPPYRPANEFYDRMDEKDGETTIRP